MRLDDDFARTRGCERGDPHDVDVKGRADGSGPMKMPYSEPGRGGPASPGKKHSCALCSRCNGSLVDQSHAAYSSAAMRRETVTYWLFVTVGFAQLGALVLIGDSTVRAKGLIPVILMLVWLGRRSRTAWWIFLVFNALELTLSAVLVLGSASGASAGSGTLWGDVITILLGSAVLIAILLSRPMRAWTSPSTVA